MRVVEITTPVRQLMLKSFAKEQPKKSDVAQIINEEAYVTVNGKIIAIYQKAGYDLSDIRTACLNLKFPTYIRQSGLITNTININASPRNGLRTNKCAFTQFRRTDEGTHDIFLGHARKIAKNYRLNFREAYVRQIKHSYIGSGRVHDAYRIKGTPFTSGVINKNTALGYHKDLANTKDGVSCMLILKRGFAGGELILPELNIGFSCQDGYILLFDGQKYIHGVTPMIPAQTGSGYRYTIVYYNNKGMSLCLAPEAEEKFFKNHLEKRMELNNLKIKNNER